MISFCPKKNLIGVNISDYSIKVVEVKCVDKRFEVMSSGMVVMDVGVVEQGRIKNAELLKKYLEKVLAEASPRRITAKDVSFAIPEKQVYSHVFEIKASQEKDLNKLAYDEALSSIPLNREDLVFSHKILERFKVVADEEAAESDAGKTKEVKMIEMLRVLVIGVQHEVMEEWKELFHVMNMEIEDFSLETFSTFQGLYENLLDHPICLVDIGASITNTSIITEHGLMYASAINAAGNHFSKKLIDGIGKKADGTEGGYDHKEVGQLKREIGMSQSEKFVNVAIILKSAMLPIVEEIKTALKYYNRKTGKVINEVILVGGSSKLKGINDYLSSNLSGLKYEMIVRNEKGKEDKEANKDIKVISGRTLRDGLEIEYAEALGLALKKYNKNWNKVSPVFPLEFKANEYALLAKENDEADETADENSEEASDNPKLAWIKEHKQLVQLLVLLVLGSMLIGWAFWYRAESTKKARLAVEMQKTYDKVFDVKVPVAIGKVSYDVGSIKARVFKDINKDSLAADKLIAKSRETAMKQIKPGEKLWKDYLNVLDEKKIIFPVTMEWLVYNEKDATAKFITEGKKQHNNDKDFGFKNVEIINLEKDGEKYYFTGKVNITTKTKPTVIATTTVQIADKKEGTDKIGTVTNAETSQSPMPTDSQATGTPTNAGSSNSIQALSELFANSNQKFVSIDESGLTWLNVRVASSTKSNILTKIYPKKIYELIEDQGEWYKIKVDETQEGWVSATYVKILE